MRQLNVQRAIINTRVLKKNETGLGKAMRTRGRGSRKDLALADRAIRLAGEPLVDAVAMVDMGTG